MTHTLIYKDHATGTTELIDVDAKTALKAQEMMGTAKGFYAGGSYIRGMDVLKVQKSQNGSVAIGSGDAFCGKCENGWLFRPDPDPNPSYHGRPLAYPCSCNVSGQEKAREYSEYVTKQSWHRNSSR